MSDPESDRETTRVALAALHRMERRYRIERFIWAVSLILAVAVARSCQ